MKRLWTGICIIVCFATAGCLSKAQPAMEPAVTPPDTVAPSPIDSPEAPPTAYATQSIKTPEEIVQLFFDRWAAYDVEGMNSLMAIRRQWYDDPAGSGIISIQVRRIYSSKSLTESQMESFEAHGFKDAYDKTVVYAEFVIESDDSGLSPFRAGKVALPWKFYLARETASSEWRIVDYGG